MGGKGSVCLMGPWCVCVGTRPALAHFPFTVWRLVLHSPFRRSLVSCLPGTDMSPWIGTLDPHLGPSRHQSAVKALRGMAADPEAALAAAAAVFFTPGPLSPGVNAFTFAITGQAFGEQWSRGARPWLQL